MTEPYYQDDLVTLHHGTASGVAGQLAPGSVRTIVTSPPYFGLRDYGHEDQIGAESSVVEYVANLVATFRALWNVLADDGTLWLNLGDTHSNKQLLGVPWTVAFALQKDGWILRSDIVWSKPNPIPDGAKDRPTKAHEYIFLFAKRKRYFYDAEAISEEISPDRLEMYQRGLATAVGQKRINPDRNDQHRKTSAGFGTTNGNRNKRSVWSVVVAGVAGAHFATYPPELIRPCILAGSARGDTVLDPFSGSGTTGMVATQEGRRYVGIDVNPEYLDLSLRTRFAAPVLDMTGGVT